MLRKIKKLHRERPAFFVLADIHGLEAGTQQALSQGGVPSLLKVLRSTNERSRFIVTQATDKIEEWAQGRKYVLREMPFPTIDRLTWYLNEGSRERYKTRLEQRLECSDAALAAKTAGDALLLLAGILALDGDDTDCATTISNHLNLLPDQPNRADQRKAQTVLVEEFAKLLRDNGLLVPFTLIAATAVTV